jgi:hypothetical protein
MIWIRFEKIGWYISTSQVEICSCVTLITMAFHKFSLCYAKHMVLYGFYIHANKNKVIIFLKIEEK